MKNDYPLTPDADGAYQEVQTVVCSWASVRDERNSGLPVGLRSAGRRPKTTRPRSRAGRVVSGVRSRPSRRRPSRRGPPLPLGTGSVGSCRWPAFPKSSRSQTAALGRSWPLSEV